jgi:hypothetical protein
MKSNVEIKAAFWKIAAETGQSGTFFICIGAFSDD